MKRKPLFPWLSGLFLAAALLTGCQSPPVAAPIPGDASVRNNCYSLLHQLLAEQKEVNLLHFIKSEPGDVKNLVGRIATASGTGARLLEDFARDDPTIRLDETRLPAGEVAARAAIASTKETELLHQTGNEFELTLLLTQTEALNYAWHMAQVAADHEPDPGRARALAGVSADMQNLYHQVFQLMLSKAKSAATNPFPPHPTR